MRFFIRMTAGAALVACAAGVAAAQSQPFSAAQAQQLRAAYDSAKDKEYWRAHRQAEAVGDRAALAMVEWMRRKDDEGEDFEGAAAWLDSHRGWPFFSTIQANAERDIPDGASAAAVLALFKGRAPRTGRGALMLAGALAQSGQGANAAAAIKRGWLELSWEAEDERAALARFGAVLLPLHAARLDRLLWDDRLTEATRMLSRVESGQRRLAEARIALIRSSKDVDARIRAVPGALADDPGLAHARMVWRQRKGRGDEAAELVDAMNGVVGHGGDAEEWARARRRYSRDALEAGDAPRAYRIASSHDLTGGGDFAELEFFAGWIALRRLKAPKLAAQHFGRLYNGVGYPVSRARAAYWTGEALAALGDAAGAARWMARAARHPETFFGQRAAMRLGRAPVDLPAPPATGKAAYDGLMARVGYAFYAADAKSEARRFMQAAAGESGVAAYQIAQIGLEIGDLRLAVDAGKDALQAGFAAHDVAFPTPPGARGDCGGLRAPEPAFAQAISRQESELDPGVVSPAGARGLMQLMPATARKVASDLGVAYSSDRLLSDPGYNARLGSCYLAEMIERFGGSYLLAAAAYNAGPNRVDDWIATFGDPRSPGVDAIDWSESIPYAETRNYVQRVIENLWVYRRKAGAPMNTTLGGPGVAP